MRCQMCEDGYYGDPLGQSGAARPCVRCDCNGNVDFNAVGICDHITGRCLKCLGHTEGDHCQTCQRGFYGNALNRTASQKCKREYQWGGWNVSSNNLSSCLFYSFKGDGGRHKLLFLSMREYIWVFHSIQYKFKYMLLIPKGNLT